MHCVHVAQRALCVALHADAANCPAAQTAHAAQPRSAVAPAPQGCASNSAPGAHALRQAVHSVLSGAAENRPLGHSSQVRSGVARVPAGHALQASAELRSTRPVRSVVRPAGQSVQASSLPRNPLVRHMTSESGRLEGKGG